MSAATGEHPGTGLRIFRQAVGLSQRELAARAGTSVYYLGGVERGQLVAWGEWRWRVLEALADRLAEGRPHA